MRTLVLTTTRSESQQYAAHFAAADNRPAIILHGTYAPSLQQEIIEWFRQTEEAVLIGHWKMLAHGWNIDLPVTVLLSSTFPLSASERAPLLQCLARVGTPLDESGEVINPWSLLK